jgi:hypothetical protein
VNVKPEELVWLLSCFFQSGQYAGCSGELPLQHRVMEREAARVFVGGDKLRVTVSSKEDVGLLTERAQYALAVTLEVAEAIEMNLYETVRTRIRPAVAIAPRA